MSMRQSKKRQNEVLLQDPVGKDAEGKEISLMDKLGCEEDVFDRVENKMQIKELYGKIGSLLTERERCIIEHRYGLGGRRVLTQKEIASNMGISRSYVSRIEKKAIEKLSSNWNNPL